MYSSVLANTLPLPAPARLNEEQLGSALERPDVAHLGDQALNVPHLAALAALDEVVCGAVAALTAGQLVIDLGQQMSHLIIKSRKQFESVCLLSSVNLRFRSFISLPVISV